MSSSFQRFFFTYRRILNLAYRVNPSLLVLVTLLQSFWGLTNLPILYINKLLIDLVISSLGQPNLTGAFRTMVFIIALRGLVEYSRFLINRFSRPLSSTLTRQINARVEIMLAEKLNSLDVPTVESPQFQDKFKKIDRELGNRIWGMIEPISEVPNSVFTIISGTIVLFAFNPWVGLLVILTKLPEMWISAKFSKLEYDLAGKQSLAYRLWGWTNYYLTNMQSFYDNKILGTAQVLSQKMSRLAAQIIDENYRLQLKRAKARNITEIPGSLLSIGLSSYFFFLALVGRISLGTAQMWYQATNTLGNGFGMFLTNMNTIYSSYLFVTDLNWLTDLRPAVNPGRLLPRLPFRKGVEFSRVWFKYPHSQTWILKDVSFTLGPHDNLAIVGENGAGKTTLIKLLAGFYPPQKGRILVNGKDIKNYRPEAYHKTLSILFQDFADYAFSAQESIGYGNIARARHLQSIQAAAKLTDIHRFIASLSLKYDTPLAKSFDQGIDPSKGQWQRIALARILFRGGQIIVLDEPTSNVDPKAEEKIFAKIIKLARDKILILISHRFSTVRRADKILVLDKGRIVEQGSHEQLMKLGGKYAQLFNLQAKSYQ